MKDLIMVVGILSYVAGMLFFTYILISSVIFFIEYKETFCHCIELVDKLKESRLVGKLVLSVIIAFAFAIESLAIGIGYICLVFIGIGKMMFHKDFMLKDFAKLFDRKCRKEI